MKIPGPIPNHILSLMKKEDRPLGPAGYTAAECAEIACKKHEKDMHDLFSQWLNLNGIPHIHARTDKRSTIQVGWPDFSIFWRGCGACVEFKVKGQKPSKDQERVIWSITKTGTQVFLCFSAQEAIEKVNEHFKLIK